MVVDRHAKQLAVIDRRRAPGESVRARGTPGSISTGVRQICLPVSTSMAKVHFPLIAYITPL